MIGGKNVKKNKKFFSVLCTLLIVISSLGVHQVFANTINGYYPAINLNVPLLTQEPNGCALASVAASESYFFNQKDSTWNKSSVYSLVKSVDGNNNAIVDSWANCGYQNNNASSENDYLMKLYNQLAQGYPVIVYRTGYSGEAQHYSVVYGYSGSSTSLTLSGFKVMNVWNGNLSSSQRTTLNQWFHHNGFSASHSSNYRYITRRRGLANASSLVSGIKFAVNHPASQHKTGSTQPVLGTVVSNSNLTSITVGVYTSSGAKKFAKSATPNTKSYNVNNLDSAMTFASLTAGDYVYKIQAKNSAGTTQTYSYSLKVTNTPIINQTISFKYSANGGNGSVATQTVKYGNTLTVASGNSLSKTGYLFKGWYAYRTTDKKYYVLGKGWYTESDISKNKYAKKVYNSGDKLVINSSWTSGNNSNTSFQFVAVWQPITYTLRYYPNGGTGSMADTVVTYGVTSNLRKNTFVRKGYTFKGWNVYSEKKGKWNYINGTSQNYYYKDQQPAGYKLTVFGENWTSAKTSDVNNDIVRMYAVWEKIPVQSVKLSSSSLTLNKGSSSQLKYSLTPSTAIDTGIKWTTSNSKVATVSNGKVTAVGAGTATITVKTSNGKTATCKITVKNVNVPIGSVKLNKSSITVNKGKTYSLTATIAPSNTTNSKTLKWSSSNSKIAKVDSKGKVTAVSNGKATITVKTSNGKTAQCTVTVPYSITYKLNGGTNNKSNPSTYYGKKITLKNPTRKGYTFSGWYSDSKFKNKVTSFSSGNKTLYAKWTKVSVAKAKTPTLTNVSGKKLKITYAATSGAKGYQIQYATNNKFSKATTKTLTGRSATYTLTKGKTYYVRVRAYKLDSTGAKVYGSWSAVKSKKITK